jgi:hypothetical protein
MINIAKVIGKSVVYTGKSGEFFTNGEAYRIGHDKHGSIYTIDNEGDRHAMDKEWLSENFDVSEYIEKPSLVGKYVRYIGEGSDFMRTGDIGIVMASRGDGQSLEVKWLNPNEPHTEGCTTWFCCAVNVEVIE